MLRLAVIAALLLPLLTWSGPAQAQNPPVTMTPPPGVGETGRVCFRLVNKSSVQLYGRLRMKSREQYTFRIDSRDILEDCFVGTTYGGNRISLVISNFLGIPLFNCWTTTFHNIELSAFRKGDAWIYTAICE